ncbi:cytochrome c oxidase subunit 5A, mitochondrial-like [Montipora capricornis]|uniref:cytochrome c oxidase subunit 5A, mitochondrial-like n=1 Tax=Montipora foliosa TaxID=591990 RepID=UPI0035F2106D
MLRCATRRLVSPYIRGVSPSLGAASRLMSSKPKESDEAFDARWKAYFERPDIDAWELRHGLNELYGKDLVPEPKILIAMFNACRRLDDFPLTVRILESVKSKAAGSQEIYNYILQEIKPTMDELGLSTPEELGLA